MGFSHFSNKAIPLRPQLAMFLEASGGLGIEKALFLQQIHYLCTSHQETGNLKYFHEGYWWVSIGYTKMRTLHFFFIPLRTLERVVAQLSKQGILIVSQIEASEMKLDNWYRISYDILDTAYVEWLATLDHVANYIPALAEDYAMLTGHKEHLQHEPLKKKRTVKPKNVATKTQNQGDAIRQNDGINPPNGRDVPYIEDSLKSKENPPTPLKGGTVTTENPQSSHPIEWDSWLSKYKPGKEWCKAKPSNLDEAHSLRWDRLFYAIATHVLEIDFKSLADTSKGKYAPRLHSMVGSIFAYTWVDDQHIARFVQLYLEEGRDIIPSKLDTFLENFERLRLDLEPTPSEPLPSTPTPPSTPSVPVNPQSFAEIYAAAQVGKGTK